MLDVRLNDVFISIGFGRGTVVVEKVFQKFYKIPPFLNLEIGRQGAYVIAQLRMSGTYHTTIHHRPMTMDHNLNYISNQVVCDSSWGS